MSNLLRVTGTAVNVRGAPTTDASVLAQVRAGNLLEMRPVTPQAPWVPVWTAEGKPGWIHGAYVTEVAPPKPPQKKWRVAKALDRLLDQYNAKAPGRSKAYDGSIGDEAHQGRASDHNALPPPPSQTDRTPVVTARDFTHDPGHGADAYVLAENLRMSKDPRIKYVIHAGRMYSSKVQPWVWRAYKGADPHRHHVHVSVDANPALYDDTRDWKV